MKTKSDKKMYISINAIETNIEGQAEVTIDRYCDGEFICNVLIHCFFDFLDTNELKTAQELSIARKRLLEYYDEMALSKLEENTDENRE